MLVGVVHHHDLGVGRVLLQLDDAVLTVAVHGNGQCGEAAVQQQGLVAQQIGRQLRLGGGVGEHKALALAAIAATKHRHLVLLG